MTSRRFKQVDVFTSSPYQGNPLAVVLDGSGLNEDDMQHFARWTNLSETTFVTPPTQTGADYAVRIFTPGGELPFAGHPTLGSCHAWLQAGGMAKTPGFVVQECKVGIVRIRLDGQRLAFAAPPLRRSAPGPAELARVASALGLKANQIITAQTLDMGTTWLGLLIENSQTLLQLSPDHVALKSIGLKVGVAAITQTHSTGEPDLEVRGFAAPIGVNEDPVTGSLNGGLAQWLIADGHLPECYLAAQGARLGRAGRIHLSREDGQVWVGGETVTCIDGTVAL